MSLEVEQALLGAALNNPEVVTQVATLPPADFFEMRHQLIWTAILQQWSEDKPIDPVSTLTVLQGMGDADRIGGAPYLFELLSVGALPATVGSHAHTIRMAAAKRRLHKAGALIQTMSDELDPIDAIAEAQHLIDTVLTVDTGEVQKIGDTIDDTLDHISKVAAGEIPKGLMSGLVELDDLTGGFRGGQMVIVAARPGVGKSTLGVDFMRQIAINARTPALLFSLEMSKHEVNERILAAEAEVRLENIRKGRLEAEEWQRLGNARDQLIEVPFYVDDNAEMPLVDIVAKTKMYTKQHKVGMMVLDYVQLLSSGGRVESRQQEVAGFSRQLKLLAKACNIPVVVIAQVNRDVDKRGDDARLKPSDLRESGALEQDADMILLINRPDAGDRDHARAGEADIDVAKNRGGRTGVATVATQLHYSRFANML